MIALIHRACGAVAYYYKHTPKSGEKMRSKYATSATGDDINIGQRLNCDFCGGYVSFGRDENGLYTKDLSE